MARRTGLHNEYYDIPRGCKNVQDINEAKDYNYAQGNILKVAMTLNSGRHKDSDYISEMEKLKYFADREIKRTQKKIHP